MAPKKLCTFGRCRRPIANYHRCGGHQIDNGTIKIHGFLPMPPEVRDVLEKLVSLPRRGWRIEFLNCAMDRFLPGPKCDDIFRNLTAGERKAVIERDLAAMARRKKDARQ